MQELVYIEWCDAMVNLSSWIGIDEAIQWSETNNWIVAEVGFILKETDEYILIANKKNLYDTDNIEVGDVMKIPTTWIKKRVSLTDYIS